MTNGIKINDVRFSYGNKKILEKLSLEINRGDFWGITGINGSGKTTFSYLLNGLIPNSIQGKLEGEITVDGIPTKNNNVAFFSQKVGMVFQNPDFSLFNLTVGEEIAFGLKNLKQENSENKIRESLKTVGMESFQNRDPQSLSYGEKQKISLASVIALKTPYIVLDEPSAMLDYKSSVEIYNILKTLNNQGTTIISIEHDTDFLWKYSQKTLILDKGQIAASGNTQIILKNGNLLTKLGIKIPNYSQE